jgi:hypothetical protein
VGDTEHLPILHHHCADARVGLGLILVLALGGLLDGHCGEFAVVLGTHRLPPNDDAPRRLSHYFTFRLRLTALQV